MYLPYYGLKKPPFSISPDPTFLWLSSIHKEAYSALKYGILEEKGFLSLIGEIGTGKTLLIKNLITEIRVPSFIVTIPDPDMKALDFFNFIANEAEMNVDFKDKGEFLIHFKQFLLKAYGSDKKVLLIIDEAQRLNFDLLEQIRLLSNIEMTDKKLLTIFFVGQNEFDQTLLDERNRASQQRIVVRCRLEPLDEEETALYIAHRLKVAGASREIFNSDAVHEIFSLSNGIPRSINIICDNALMIGYGFELETINGGFISENKKDLHIPDKIEANEGQDSQLTQSNQKTSTVLLNEKLELETTQAKQKISDQAFQPTQRKEESDRRSSSYFKNLIIFVFLLLLGFSGYFIYDKNTAKHARWTAQDIAPKRNFGFSETKKEENKAKDKNPVEKQLNNQVANGPQQTATDGDMENTLASQSKPEKQVDLIQEKPITQDIANNSDRDKRMESRIESVIPKIIDADTIKDQSNQIASAISDINKDASASEKSPLSINHLIIDGRIMIYYKYNSLDLSEQSNETLKLVFGIISKYPDSNIIVNGYTDTSGNFWHNKKLSQSRANVIKNYFTDRGISPTRIKAQGMGSQNPVGDNRTKEGRRQNRRAEIEIKMEAETSQITLKKN
ncbi:MAG: OmpA family protein [Desulfobacterales bacterium]|nr:OmpA family protein [Desulfobacterales bacterium]